MSGLTYHIADNALEIKLEGNCGNFDNPSLAAELYALLSGGKILYLKIDGTSLTGWNAALSALSYGLSAAAERRNIKIETVRLPEDFERMRQLALAVHPHRPDKTAKALSFLERTGAGGLDVFKAVVKGGDFLAECLAALGRWIVGRAVMRRIDFWFALENASYRAVPIVALVSFMVGLILAFVGSIQLRNFGAQIYVASLVSIGMTRIMGAIMAGIIMSGRTGASYAATIGSMQANEEVDALKTMGIPPLDFLVLPRLLSLMITMPFLTILSDFSGIFGGMAVGVFMLGIPFEEYWRYSVDALGLSNFLVGLFHGWVYGIIIALCGCYYGIFSGRNADGVGKATTMAVVSSIVWMIVVTGGLTWFFSVVEI